VTVVVFAIVVTEKLVGTKLSHTSRNVFRGALAASAFLVFIASRVMSWQLPTAAAPAMGDTTREIGTLVVTRFVLPFELLSVVLLVSLIGASYLARPEE
jgi:NADH-quinone oxidoreductase subunit J